MRQSQKSNRTRGRGRKAANPLSRSYDSNGPDVKIRGTASHIAEKYQSLARDAIASGDLVMAENYYQHAEHYLRIIAASQPAPQPASRDEGRPNNGDGPNNNNASRKPANVNSDNGDEASNNKGVEVEDTASEMEVVAIAEVPGSGEQPVIEPPAEVVDEEVAAAGAPRRRRRTTYRSRKRPTAAERKAEGGEGGDAAPKEKPAAVAAED